MSLSTETRITRRRALFIGAACLGGLAIPAAQAAAAPAVVSCWRGNALGAHATIELVGVEQDRAWVLFEEIENELARLERIFSLYRTDSSLVRLNAEGRLLEPPAELLEVLSLAAAVHRQTGGLFDPSVQPLFKLYAEHFSAGGSSSGPSHAEMQDCLGRVGFGAVGFDSQEIQFARPGMALTLNGIAQGYISDRITGLLRAKGLGNMLINMGEIVTVGSGPDQSGWRVGLGTTDRARDVLILADRAVATSSVTGTVLDRNGRIGHIFHPRLGAVAPSNAIVSVVDMTAARADALSTAAALMSPDEISGLRLSGVEIHI